MKSTKEALRKGLSTGDSNAPGQQPLQNELVAEEIEPPVVIYPEWNDADIAAEKWTTKHIFEDVDVPLAYPRSLRQMFDHFKRPAELVSDGQTPTVLQSVEKVEDYMHGKGAIKGSALGFGSQQSGMTFNSSFGDMESADEAAELGVEKSELPIISGISSKSGSLANSIGNLADKSLEGSLPEDGLPVEKDPLDNTSKLFQANQHLLSSEFMTQILCNYHFLFDQGKPARLSGSVDDFCPWDNIYPKNKDGSPMYNPSGKYAVRLFWLGAWRKIVVDDRLPFSSLGKPLLVTSPTVYELWPYLICKALLKIAVYR